MLVLPGAIIPDVIEWEQNRTGSRLEGTFSGLAKFSWQFATGACFFVVGHLLYATGYDGETPPTERILEGLRIMFIALPGVLLLAAIAVFSRFPITPEIYEELVDRPIRDDDVSRS